MMEETKEPDWTIMKEFWEFLTEKGCPLELREALDDYINFQINKKQNQDIKEIKEILLKVYGARLKKDNGKLDMDEVMKDEEEDKNPAL